jgi:hypothetical protein
MLIGLNITASSHLTSTYKLVAPLNEDVAFLYILPGPMHIIPFLRFPAPGRRQTVPHLRIRRDHGRPWLLRGYVICLDFPVERGPGYAEHLGGPFLHAFGLLQRRDYVTFLHLVEAREFLSGVFRNESDNRISATRDWAYRIPAGLPLPPDSTAKGCHTDDDSCVVFAGTHCGHLIRVDC